MIFDDAEPAATPNCADTALGEPRTVVEHWNGSNVSSDNNIRLEPLHPRHASAWLHLSRDKDVAVLTQLPRFATRKSAFKWVKKCWLATCAVPSDTCVQRCTLAIVNHQGTFQGSVSLWRNHDAGFFSFWVGAPHQGRGVGSRAARLTQSLAAERFALADLFTASWRCNHRAHRVLAKTDWRQLPFEGLGQSSGVAFFHHSTQEVSSCQPGHLHTRLVALLRDIGSNFTLAELAPRVASEQHRAPLTGGR